jgi:hypothetical protein
MKLWNIFRRRPTKMPKDVQRAFLKILYFTCLAIRNESKRPDLCFAFSDHAHNIPGLIANYSPDAFRYYWECERPCFIEALQKREFSFGLFDEHWAVLEKYYKNLK